MVSDGAEVRTAELQSPCPVVERWGTQLTRGERCSHSTGGRGTTVAALQRRGRTELNPGARNAVSAVHSGPSPPCVLCKRALTELLGPGRVVTA